MYGSPRLAKIIPLLLLIPMAFLISRLINGEFYFFLINMLLTNLVLALGLDLLVGKSGQFAFSHIAFFGVGAYATTLLQTAGGLTFPASLPLSTALSGCIGVLIAIPATRMRSINLALATFAFAQGMQWLFGAWESLTGGANGLSVPAPRILGFVIDSDTKALPWMTCIALLCVAATLYIGTSKLGRSMAAIRESESAAAVSGIGVRATKITVFGISAGYAGIAGGMLTLHQSFIDPSRFGFEALILVFSMIVVGGMGSTAGTAAGVLVLTLLPELMRGSMRDLLIWQEFVYGIILILCMMFMPRGIWGAVRRLRIRRESA
jgi:branched-chain amino acid transport system permease protein